MTNPWKDKAPDCPFCEIQIRMYLWEFEDPDRWYCARCQRIYNMREERDIGGQETLPFP